MEDLSLAPARRGESTFDAGLVRDRWTSTQPLCSTVCSLGEGTENSVAMMRLS